MKTTCEGHSIECTKIGVREYRKGKFPGEDYWVCEVCYKKAVKEHGE